MPLHSKRGHLLPFNVAGNNTTYLGLYANCRIVVRDIGKIQTKSSLSGKE
jgi:hypothetical protein